MTTAPKPGDRIEFAVIVAPDRLAITDGREPVKVRERWIGAIVTHVHTHRIDLWTDEGYRRAIHRKFGVWRYA